MSENKYGEPIKHNEYVIIKQYLILKNEITFDSLSE